MKKIILSTLIIFAIALTACSSLTNGTSATSTQTGDELPIETQLVVGTLDLNGTEQDVTAEQAQELIVLWQVYNEISQSDTAAQEEVDTGKHDNRANPGDHKYATHPTRRLYGRTRTGDCLEQFIE